ncbi:MULTISPECIES: PAS domain S-box protein [unclassified Massilia]|uniref:PAS domain-containing sensor histidine kinase n=1 Tax=unclassified Massilia TaxID=2609279 RepID=UPI0017866B3F|nr:MULTISPECIES: PAS domain S-box protein [unclassified Massilia]MBD8531708.1 PAS domain S-box protein [Massilia sp. CFBP 13647]MBD8675153.1 PAS domain S-box protein [Massilia sp. CFBP 13721]
MAPDSPSSASGPNPHPSSETRFRELFEQAPTSIQILAPDGRTLRVNKAWEDLWEIHAGTSLYAFILSDEYSLLSDPQLVDSGIAGYLRQALAGESVEVPAVYYDVTVLGGSGRARWVTARAHPIKDAGGRILEVMLMHEDITERVLSENALREREQRFRSLVMATSQTVWSTAPDGRVLEDSPSWRAVTGQSYEEWKETGWLDAVHPDDRERAHRTWMECTTTRAVYETEYRLRQLDGSYRWTAVKGVPIEGADGTVREWIGANKDIHAMVTAQAELAARLGHEQRHSALLIKVAQASRTLGSALASEDIAAGLVEEVRAILEVHQAVVSLNVGGDQEINAVSMSDKYARYRSYAVKPDGSGIYAYVCRTNQVLRLTQAQLEAHPAWKGFGSHAAQHPPIRGWLAVPLVDRKGQNIGLIQASDKIEGEFSEQDEAILVQLASIAANGFENARLYSSLKEQDRRKDEFLAMLAHELRNPLAPISAAAELLKIGSASEERVRRSSEVICRQVKHLTSLVDDLLDISRVTRGLIQLENVAVDVNATIGSAVEQARPLIAARDHALTVRQAPPGSTVAGDPNRLVQVLANLLNNAAKYTPRGGRILLAAECDGTHVHIRVQDNGIGIDRHLLPQVFDLFTQAERTPDRSQGGLGIGLALVKNVVGLHGGTVTAHSDGPGTGSTFTVSLHTV